MLPVSLLSRVVYLPLLILLLALVSCSTHGYLVGFFPIKLLGLGIGAHKQATTMCKERA